MYTSSLVSGSGYAKLTGAPVAVMDYTDSDLQTAQTRYYRRNVGRYEQQRKRLLKRGGRNRPLNPRSTATATSKGAARSAGRAFIFSGRPPS